MTRNCKICKQDFNEGGCYVKEYDKDFKKTTYWLCTTHHLERYNR